MALDLRMIHSAVRIIGDVPNPKSKIGRKRGPIGTGFLFDVPSETRKNVYYTYAITADHVLDGQPVVAVQAPNPFTNGDLYDPVPITEWRRPLEKVDLALAAFPHHPDRTYQALPIHYLIPEAHKPVLGATVFYVGILTPLDRPMARSGTIGAVDQLGIEHDGGYEYPAHLVDCRSYGGFSGSPCFSEGIFAQLVPIDVARFYPPGRDLSNLPPMGLLRYHVRLCGMFTQHLTERDETEISRYGVGVLVRSEEIREAVMTDELRKERREWDAEDATDKSGPQLGNVGGHASTEDEFERFEDLTRKLVNTPKTEIDEKRKRDK